MRDSEGDERSQRRPEEGGAPVERGTRRLAEVSSPGEVGRCWRRQRRGSRRQTRGSGGRGGGREGVEDMVEDASPKGEGGGFDGVVRVDRGGRVDARGRG
jgi:hypothetical protein